MTIGVSPTKLSVRDGVNFYLHDAIRRFNDRVVLTVFFAWLFSFHYAPYLFERLKYLVAKFNNVFEYAAPDSHATLSAAELLGFFAIAVVLKDLKADRVLKWWDFATITGVAIACLYPSRPVWAIGMTCLGLLQVARRDERIASLGQLCLGLVWLDFWGPLVLGLIAQWLLPIETAFAFFPLSFMGSFAIDGTIISNTSGHAIEVLEPCSAFHNTITTAFIWLSLIKIQRLDFRLKHVYFLAIGLAAIVLINTARISIMAISEQQYLFWHLGPGIVIVKAMMLGVVLGFFYFGLRPGQKRAA